MFVRQSLDAGVQEVVGLICYTVSKTICGVDYSADDHSVILRLPPCVLSAKKARLDKKQASITSQSERPSLESRLSQEPNKVSNPALDGVGKEVWTGPPRNIRDVDKGVIFVDIDSPTPAAPNKGFTPVPAHSLLDHLAEQALARDPSVLVPQEILAAAIAKYKYSTLGHHWGFGVNTKSPPPPPQSSPVGFPVNRVCHVVLTQPLQTGHYTKTLDVGQSQIVSDDSCRSIQ